jgi:hypothetical protein
MAWKPGSLLSSRPTFAVYTILPTKRVTFLHGFKRLEN